MTRKTVVLTAEARAICRVRYRQVATYIDPGSQPMTPNDRVVQAIAGHYKNGEVLEHGPEHSGLLFPFGNKRAVSRHVNKGSAKTAGADREIALAWVETQPQDRQAEILALLGLADKDSREVKDEEDADSGVKQEAGEIPLGEKRKHGDVDDTEEDSKAGVVKDEEDVDSGVKQETGEISLGEKRKHGDVDDAEEGSKAGVLSKRPRQSAAQGAPADVKQEATDAPVKIEA
ncbi:hypothetical protein FB451DRAFT_1366924 [Mycena latifolia]|nr:hypothetical protein FB451DRAFT_1366924 [Mycena latifolia]